jgi:hypothetical protein
MVNAPMNDPRRAYGPGDLGAHHAPTITVSLEIKNHYTDGTLVTVVTDRAVAKPWDLDDEDELAGWAMQELFEYTGTGRAEGDSAYDITIIAADDHRLVSKTFEIG